MSIENFQGPGVSMVKAGLLKPSSGFMVPLSIGHNLIKAIVVSASLAKLNEFSGFEGMTVT